MNKSVYLERLRKYLEPLPREEIDDIVRDQEEYINDAVSSGRSEQEVLSALGDPKSFANRLLAESKIQQAEETTSLNQQLKRTSKAVLAILALTPLNIFFVLIPLMLIIFLTFIGWVVALSLLAAAGGILVVFFTKLITLTPDFWTNFSFFFFALGLVGMGILAVIVAYQITKFFVHSVLAYLKWNLKFIQSRMRGESYETK